MAIFLWALIEQKGIEGFRKDAIGCVQNAEYLYSLLKEAKFNPLLNNCSNIVSFNEPSKEVVKRWQLATDDKRAHVVVMPHVTKEIIDLFLFEAVSNIIET